MSLLLGDTSLGNTRADGLGARGANVAGLLFGMNGYLHSRSETKHLRHFGLCSEHLMRRRLFYALS